MDVKSLLYNSITISLPKNTVQFLLGSVIFWLVFGSMNVATLGLALVAFLSSYSAVYFFNDLSDYEEDSKDDDKKAWKLLANGIITKNQAVAGTVVLLVLGLSLSILVNVWFLLIMITLIGLNLLHSSPYTRLKKNMPATSMNMTLIEFLKYSSGWFALTSNLTAFPFWLMMCFALSYTAIYLIYKSKFKRNMIKENKVVLIPLGLASAFSFFISFFFYNYALPLLILIAATFVLAKFGMGKKLKLMKWFILEFAILPIIVISFLVLSIPTVAQANENITGTIDQYKENIYEKLPEEVVSGIKNFTESKYGSLEELQNAINQSFNLSDFKFTDTEKE